MPCLLKPIPQYLMKVGNLLYNLHISIARMIPLDLENLLRPYLTHLSLRMEKIHL